MKLTLMLLLLPVAASAQTPPPAFTRDTLSVTPFSTHVVEGRRAGSVRWYPMLNGSIWIARDGSGRAVEEWDRFATDTWRERRTGRTIRRMSDGWRSDNGDTLRRAGRDAEIRDASGFRVNTVQRAP